VGRVFIIVVAAVLGAAGTWMFIPTAQLAPANTSTAALSQDSADSNEEAAKTPKMTEAKRRMRAEQLIGNPLKYITRDEAHGVNWFRERGEQALERAMDECYLLTNAGLYLQHIEALADEADIENAKTNPGAVVEKFRPTFTQMSSCANARIVYGELH
jgi:hypothetical protein